MKRRTFLRPAQDINLSGFGARAQFVYVLRSNSNDVLYRNAQKIAAALQKRPELTDVSSDLELGARAHVSSSPLGDYAGTDR